MGRVTAEVWALLQERQDLRKADPSATWGAELLLDTEHTPLPSRSLLFPPRAPTRAGSRRGASSPSAQRPYLRRPDYGRFEQVTGLPLSRPARPPMFAGAPAPIPPAAPERRWTAADQTRRPDRDRRSTGGPAVSGGSRFARSTVTARRLGPNVHLSPYELQLGLT